MKKFGFVVCFLAFVCIVSACVAGQQTEDVVSQQGQLANAVAATQLARQVNTVLGTDILHSGKQGLVRG